MIVENSDFTGEILIANKVGPSGVAENLQGFICKYEPIWLRDVMGFEFSTLFISGLDEDPVDARWTALLTPNGYDLKTAIANYTYYWYQRRAQRVNVAVGTVKPKSANAEISNDYDEVCRAWFEMTKTAWQTLRYLVDNPGVYPEFVAPKWYNTFALSWAIWGFSADIFGSPFYYGFTRLYCIPDIFIPLVSIY